MNWDIFSLLLLVIAMALNIKANALIRRAERLIDTASPRNSASLVSIHESTAAQSKLWKWFSFFRKRRTSSNATNHTER